MERIWQPLDRPPKSNPSTTVKEGTSAWAASTFKPLMPSPRTQKATPPPSPSSKKRPAPDREREDKKKKNIKRKKEEKSEKNKNEKK